MVCPVCGTQNPETARFCMQCGTALGMGGASGVSAVGTEGAPGVVVAGGRKRRTRGRPTRHARAASAPVRRALDAARPADAVAIGPAERRIVTVLFADLSNSTQLADTMDPEDLRTLLTMFFARMTHEVHRHGGIVENYVGDAIMAVFGLPVAHEDDPVRAVRAGLGMRTALEQFNAELQPQTSAADGLHLHIGINTGEVVAATGASATEGHDFLITGDAVNVAARLQQASAPDSILVGPAPTAARAAPSCIARSRPSRCAASRGRCGCGRC